MSERSEERRDGTGRLCRAVYGREALSRDYLGGSEARMLYDASNEINALRQRVGGLEIELKRVQYEAIEHATKAVAAESQRDALAGALRAADDVARQCGQDGLCDAIDNDGVAYQSQHLADLLAATPKPASCPGCAAKDAALREVEWEGMAMGGVCPACRGFEHNGHLPGCSIAAVLAAIPDVEKPQPDQAAIVDRLIADLDGRRGLGQEWRQIDDEIQSEIRDVWGRIVREGFGDGDERERRRDAVVEQGDDTLCLCGFLGDGCREEEELASTRTCRRRAARYAVVEAARNTGREHMRRAVMLGQSPCACQLCVSLSRLDELAGGDGGRPTPDEISEGLRRAAERLTDGGGDA